jgi:DNA-binding transcriptional LysR family regulator
MAVCVSGPQACIASTSLPKYWPSAWLAKGRPEVSLTGNASMSAHKPTAARRLDMSVPSVTRLEAHLGTRLRQRTARSVSMTPADIKYAERVRDILESVDEAFWAAQDSTATELAEYMIGPLAQPFMARYPEIALDVYVVTDPSPDPDRYDITLLGSWHGMDVNIVAHTPFSTANILCAAQA